MTQSLNRLRLVVMEVMARLSVQSIYIIERKTSN